MKVKLDKLVETHLEKFIKFMRSGKFYVDGLGKGLGKISLETAVVAMTSTELLESFVTWLEAGEPME